ncbi:MAG TPA: HAMP domain-containing sensor histidine kinase [Gemmataceae bacterium]|nr:HAMP domain-containing sensor histidine kinase [Gemmataceae bacterium]
MASRWRFRHKLILAHGLVVAIVLVLLCGTLYGLISYRTTTRTFSKKLGELSQAEEFRSKVRELADAARTNDVKALDRHIGEAKQSLQIYDKLIKDYTDRGFEIPYAYKERDIIDGLFRGFDHLEDQLGKVEFFGGDAGRRSLAEDPKIKKPIDSIRDSAEDLLATIRGDLCERVINGANLDYKLSLWFVLGVTGVGIILMTGSLRFFYQWIFYPIRDLQLGVAKVATGNFKHHIDVKSSDEIQDLAAAFNDMTRQLDDMYTDLARQVNERSRQLVRSERLASVGFLAAGVAHEINNPLASIAFCSEALERRVVDMLAQIPASSTAAEESKVITKYLKMIQQESFRCKEITSRLLEFSRGGERHREPTDLSELIQNVLDMVQHLQNRQGKEILFHQTQPVVALVNMLEIKSVVVNLVVNALDSMDEGGTLSINLGLRDGMAEMVFQDTGCGMSEETLENIFEPFFTRSRTGKGTGLGLSICHRIINHHQGEIEAHSAGPDQGSTFVVRLPLQPADEQPVHDNKELRLSNHDHQVGRRAA